MDDLVPERNGNCERIPVDFCARARRSDRRGVASSAANLGKERFASTNSRSYGPARWGLSGSYEVGKRHNIFTIVLWISHGIERRTEPNQPATGRVFFRKQRSGDSHFVEVGIA